MQAFTHGLGRKSEHVLRVLQQELRSGMPAGGRLPTEHELCERFGASRGTIRRALSRLAAEGLIEVRQGSGAFVTAHAANVQDRPVSKTVSVMFPFSRSSLKQVHRDALDEGYLLSVFSHDTWDPKDERSFLERVLAERHRALLAFCTPVQPRNEELLKHLERAGVRVIHIEHFREQLPDESYVMPDYHGAGYKAATALLIAQYKNLVYVSNRADGPYATIIQSGFIDALNEFGQGYDEKKNWFNHPYNTLVDPDSRKAYFGFLDSLPDSTGLLCRTVELSNAMGQYLKERGRRIPQDIGVIGVDHLVSDLGQHPNCDVVDFDWLSILKKAMAEVSRANWQGIRYLEPSRYISHGSVRGIGASYAGR